MGTTFYFKIWGQHSTLKYGDNILLQNMGTTFYFKIWGQHSTLKYGDNILL